VVKTGQLSGTCNVQCFQLQKMLMAASIVEKNNSNKNNIDLATYTYHKSL